MDQLNCHGCGARYQRAKLEPGEWARCTRCDHLLETHAVLGASGWLALLLTALLVLVIANSYPLATLNYQGLWQSATFFDAVRMTWETGYPEVALMTVAVGFVLPLTHLLLLLWVFFWFTASRRPPGFEQVLAWIDRLKPWCMIPVLLIGVLVSAVKLADLASLTPDVGLFAIAVEGLLLTALSRLDSHKLHWMAHDMGLPLRPSKPVRAPSPAGFTRTWALLCSAAILYIPANLLPIMSVSGVVGASSHTIMGGIIELWQLGSWDVASVVFIASIVVPLFKLTAMVFLVWSAQKKSGHQLKERTRLYALVELIGQWSMLDVFVVILLCALVRFGTLMSIEPSAGAAAFGGVVVLTMIAAMGFDPRLAWRRAGYRRYLKQEPGERDDD